MQKTIRILRVVLPILLLGFLAVIALSYSRSGNRQEPVAETERSTIRERDAPRLIAYEFEDTHTLGGRVSSRIRALRTMGFESGWYTLEQVEISMFRADGTSYELRAPMAQFHAETKEAEARGGVKITSADHLEIATSDITFDGHRLVNRVPVRFRVDQWSGTAQAVNLDVAEERLTLSEGVSATLTPSEPSEPAVTLEARVAVFDRETGEADFRDEVVTTRQQDRIRSDVVNARFDASRRVLTALGGHGNVSMFIGPTSGLEQKGGGSLPGSKTIAADAYELGLGGRGEIRTVKVVGDPKPARAELAGPPRRVVHAQHFVMALSDGAVSSIEAMGKAKIEEPVTRRQMRAETIRLYLDQATGEISGARLEGGLKYEDPRNRASAPMATYDARQDLLILHSSAGTAPTVSSEDHLIKGDVIEVVPGARTLKAQGNTVTRLSRASGGAGGNVVFSESGEPVYVNAESLVLREQEGIALFRGRVRAWQQNNTVFADELQIMNGGETLEARGGVRSILHGLQEGGAVSSRSDRLTANKSERTLVLNGTVTIEDPTRHLAAKQATFFLNADQRVERIELTGDLTIREKQTGRVGKGSKAVYHVPEKRILLEGEPATVQEARGTIKGTQILFDLQRNRVEVISGGEPTEATYRPEGKGGMF